MHPYQLSLAINDIHDTWTAAKSLPTNGLCERFHTTIPQVFDPVAFREMPFGSLEELQQNLDAWIVRYCADRTHPGQDVPQNDVDGDDYSYVTPMRPEKQSLDTSVKSSHCTLDENGTTPPARPPRRSC